MPTTNGDVPSPSQSPGTPIPERRPMSRRHHGRSHQGGRTATTPAPGTGMPARQRDGVERCRRHQRPSAGGPERPPAGQRRPSPVGAGSRLERPRPPSRPPRARRLHAVPDRPGQRRAERGAPRLTRCRATDGEPGRGPTARTATEREGPRTAGRPARSARTAAPPRSCAASSRADPTCRCTSYAAASPSMAGTTR